MEATKTIASDVEFDVIYDDESKHRVKEGCLVEVCDDEVVWHNGTDRLSVVFAAASCMLDVIGITGTSKVFAAWLDDPQSSSTVSVLRDIFRELFKDSSEKQAVFRLGQMDMKVSILDMLLDAANNAVDESRTGLIVAANLVETMEVPNEDA